MVYVVCLLLLFFVVVVVVVGGFCLVGWFFVCFWFVLFCFVFVFCFVCCCCWFLASNHPSRTWISGSFESVRWNACVHRLDLGLYSYPKEFLGNGVRTHVDSKLNVSSTEKKFSPEEDWTRDAASGRTASPTHYQRAIPAPWRYCWPRLWITGTDRQWLGMHVSTCTMLSKAFSNTTLV